MGRGDVLREAGDALHGKEHDSSRSGRGGTVLGTAAWLRWDLEGRHREHLDWQQCADGGGARKGHRMSGVVRQDRMTPWTGRNTTVQVRQGRCLAWHRSVARLGSGGRRRGDLGWNSAALR